MKATHRYYIVEDSRVPSGNETDSATDAERFLKIARARDPGAYIVDNKDFGNWP